MEMSSKYRISSIKRLSQIKVSSNKRLRHFKFKINKRLPRINASSISSSPFQYFIVLCRHAVGMISLG